MKIVFLSDDFPPFSFGGAGISTFELARCMQEMGHDVSVVTTCRKPEDAGEVKYENIKVVSIESSYKPRWRAYLSIYNPKVIWQLEKILSKIDPDIVHINNVHYYLSYHSCKVAKKYARGVVFTARDVMSFSYGKLATEKHLRSGNYKMSWHDHVAYAGKRYNPLRNICIKKYLSYPDKLFAVSDELKSALTQNGITGVETIHTGIDRAHYVVSENEKETFREKHNLVDKKILFFGGRLSEAKGGKKILEALVRIAQVIPDVILLIAGDKDAYIETIQGGGDAQGISHKLCFTGWLSREDIRSALAVSDVVLVPSVIFDAFPRVVLEAMALKKPVIGTCFGGAKEIIQNGVTGYVVNPLFAEDIAEKTITLLEDSTKRAEFGEASYARVIQEFNITNKAKKYILVYESCINKNKR